jgi:hypothetical protein
MGSGASGEWCLVLGWGFGALRFKVWGIGCGVGCRV